MILHTDRWDFIFLILSIFNFLVPVYAKVIPSYKFSDFFNSQSYQRETLTTKRNLDTEFPHSKDIFLLENIQSSDDGVKLVDKKSNEETFSQPRATTDQILHTLSTRRFYRGPHFRVVIDGRRDNWNVPYYKMYIASSPILSVFEAIYKAAVKFLTENSGEDNPFNVVIDYDAAMGCYRVVTAANLTNENGHFWKIKVTRSRRKILYSGICIPLKKFRIRPGTKITIRYV